MHNNSADQFLLGVAIPSAKFPTVGTTITGTISQQPEVQQQRDLQTGEPKTWSDGQPMQQLKVVLDTAERDPQIADDDGQRALYIKSNLQKAVRDAVRSVGAKGLEVGGKLTVTYTADGEVTKRGFNPPKIYTAVYESPSAPALEGLVGPAPQAPAVQPPVQQAPAAPAAPVDERAAALAQLTPAQLAAIGITPAQQAALAAGQPPF